MNNVTAALANISEMTGDAIVFLKIRSNLERYEKEAAEGNKDSQKIVDMVYQFDRLLKALNK